MAFIATKSQAEAYENLKEQCRKAHQVASDAVPKLDANTDANAIIGFVYSLKGIDDKMSALAATPGIAAYAKDEEANPAYEVVTEYNAASAAIGSALTWVQNNFPTDGSGYLLGWQFGATALTPRTFTPAATAGLKTELQAVIDAITV